MKKFYWFRIAVLSAVAGLSALSAARADATFDYAGTPFAEGAVGGMAAPLQDTSVYGSSLVGTVSFDGIVTSSYTGAVTSSDVLSWSLLAGPNSLSSSTSGDVLISANFTFVNGVITAWTFQASYPTANSMVELFTVANTVGFFSDGSVIYPGPTGNVNNTSSSSNGVGTWTEVASTSAPEPASLVLLGTGMLGSGLIRRRRP